MNITIPQSRAREYKGGRRDDINQFFLSKRDRGRDLRMRAAFTFSRGNHYVHCTLHAIDLAQRSEIGSAQWTVQNRLT